VVEKKGIKVTRITGAENEQERRDNMRAFQNSSDDTRVVFITMAASEAINLQTAKAIIFIDSPWSAGDFLQILGRMIRIGSVHDRVYAVHLVVNNSVDGHVMKVLRRKIDLINKTLGKRIKGEDEADFVVEESNDILSLFGDLQQDAKKLGKT
jgi:SNF2 family DNA or RNA helicase